MAPMLSIRALAIPLVAILAMVFAPNQTFNLIMRAGFKAVTWQRTLFRTRGASSHEMSVFIDLVRTTQRDSYTVAELRQTMQGSGGVLNPEDPNAHREWLECNGVRGVVVVPPKAGPAVNFSANWILYYHGGGYVLGLVEDYVGAMTLYGKATKANIFIVEYPLLPDVKFGAIQEALMAGYECLLDKGVSGDRIVLYGDSAGGNAVLQVELLAQSRGRPLPAGAVLDSPMGDAGGHEGCDDGMIHPGLVATLTPVLEPYKSEITIPGRPTSAYKGFPPHFIVAGLDDCVHGDSRRVHAKLSEAGVNSTFYEPVHLPHIMTTVAADWVPEAAESHAKVCEFILSVLPQ